MCFEYIKQNSIAEIVSTMESFLVAGVGLEPHDLRVMSPTSYHLLHPAILSYTISICRFYGIMHTSGIFFHDYRHLVPETGIEPVRYFRTTGF